MLIVILGFVVALIVAHETAHVLATLALGGQFDGIFMRHLKVRVDGLSRCHVVLTLLAAPFAELIVMALAWQFYPSAHRLWLMMLCIQWVINLTPLPWVPTDGRKLWLLLYYGSDALAKLS